MARRARLVGFDHVAVEVSEVEEAPEFYGRIFEVRLRRALPAWRPSHRHVGLMVNKRAIGRTSRVGAGTAGQGPDLLDLPNLWWVAEYEDLGSRRRRRIWASGAWRRRRTLSTALEERFGAEGGAVAL